MCGHRLELDPQPRGVAQRAVGVGEGVEQVVARPGGDHLARAGEHVHLRDRLVRQSVAEAGRLDAEAGHGAAERDRAQLRHHHRDQSVRQGRVDEVLVGAHALHVGGAGRRVDLDHAGQAGDVEAGRGGSLPAGGRGWWSASRAGRAVPPGWRRTTHAAARPRVRASSQALPSVTRRQVTSARSSTLLGIRFMAGGSAPPPSGTPASDASRRHRSQAPRRCRNRPCRGPAPGPRDGGSPASRT